MPSLFSGENLSSVAGSQASALALVLGVGPYPASLVYRVQTAPQIGFTHDHASLRPNVEAFDQNKQAQCIFAFTPVGTGVMEYAYAVLQWLPLCRGSTNATLLCKLDQQQQPLCLALNTGHSGHANLFRLSQ